MLSRLYRTLQYLSIDIVLGAVILLRFFSKQLDVSISIQTYALLAGSVWLIYSIDHFKDVKFAREGTRGRYRFHRSYEKPIKIAMLLVLIVCMGMLVFIEKELLISGSVLGFLSFIYLFVHQFLSKLGAKEAYVALVYSIGILLAPFTSLKMIVWELLVLLVLLSLSNLILFSWNEKAEDEADGFSSIATVMKDSSLERILVAVLALGVTLTLLMNMGYITMYFFISFMIYLYLFIKADQLKNNERYRAIADSVFLLPIVFEWV